jgi:hypothetical protein
MKLLLLKDETLVNGLTLRSFVGNRPWSDSEHDDGNVHANTVGNFLNQPQFVKFELSFFFNEIVPCVFLINDASLFAPTDCSMFNLEENDIKEGKLYSILKKMANNTVSSEMLEWVNDKWGNVSVP